MSSSSCPVFSLDLCRAATLLSTNVPAPGSPRSVAVSGRDSRLASVRSRTRPDRTPRNTNSSTGTNQEAVHVTIRLKPLLTSSETDESIRFSIEPGTFGSPRNNRRHAGKCSSTISGCPNDSTRRQSMPSACNGNGDLDENNIHSNTGPISPLKSLNGNHSPYVKPSSSCKILTLTESSGDSSRGVQRLYEFGEVMGPDVTDAQFCDATVPIIIEQLKSGFNACVLCYGQTGSGKTHTINALTPAFVRSLFDTLDAENEFVEVSYIQIHNNSAYNLLASGKAEHGVRLQKPKGALVREPRYLVRDATDALTRINEAQHRRFVASHVLNARSSRSHAILSLHITKCVGGVPVMKCRLTLGDLAGSERVKRTGVAGEELEEAIAINKSLSVLHSVLKATASDAEVLPVRESILTLYLASTLADCYLLLIATVSLDRENLAETRSSLDFASMAKRCVVNKGKSNTTDVILRGGAYSYEETYALLVKEIETLQNRVSTLQEEAKIERTRAAASAPPASTTPLSVSASGNTNVNTKDTLENNLSEAIRARVATFEQQCAVLQGILCDREMELSSLTTRREEACRVAEQQAAERDEAQRALEEIAPQLETSEALRCVSETFLWLQEQLDGVCEERRVEQRAAEGLRLEHNRNVTALLDARRRLVEAERSAEEMRQSMSAALAESAELRVQLEELNLKLLREYVERAIREETMSWFKASGERAEECARLTSAIEDQQNLCDVLQGRLTSTEQELDRSNHQQGRLLQEMRRKDEAFRSIWQLLTPQQKTRFMSIGYGGSGAGSDTFGANSTVNGFPSTSMNMSTNNNNMGSAIAPAGFNSVPSVASPPLPVSALALATASTASTLPAAAASVGGGSSSGGVCSASSASLLQGHENVQLRGQLRTLRRQLEDEALRGRERDNRIEDLEAENRHLQDRLRNREEEYAQLVALDRDYRVERDQMERQIAHLYTYIDELNGKERGFERQLREAQAECGKLDEEHRTAQRDVADLAQRLSGALAELRVQAADRDRLKNQLREAHLRDTMAFGAQHPQQHPQHPQQQQLQLRSAEETTRRVVLAERRRQHIAGEPAAQQPRGGHGEIIRVRAAQREADQPQQQQQPLPPRLRVASRSTPKAFVASARARRTTSPVQLSAMTFRRFHTTTMEPPRQAFDATRRRNT